MAPDAGSNGDGAQDAGEAAPTPPRLDDAAADDSDDDSDDDDGDSNGPAAPTLNLAAASARKDSKTVFLHLDADGSGMLDLDEIKEALEAEGLRLDQEELEAAVSAMDPSGDDVIDEGEFLDWWRENEEMRETMFGAILRKAQRAEGLKPLHDRMYILFDHLDEDGGGYLEQHELTWALTKAFSNSGIPAAGVKAACDAAMREMDEDGDDQIDFGEFFAWCANNQGLAEALERSVLGADAAPAPTPEPEPELEPEPEPELQDGGGRSADRVGEPAPPVVVRKFPNDTRVTTTELMRAFRRERALFVSEQLPEPLGDEVLVERIQDQKLVVADTQVDAPERSALLGKYAKLLDAAVADGLSSDDRSSVEAVVEAICRVVEWEGMGAPGDESYITCRTQFASLDEDGSGELEEEEIRALAEQLGNTLSDSELDIAMKKMDADGSGAVDFAEFYEWWSENKDQEGGLFASIAAEIEKQRKIEEMRAEAKEMFDFWDDDDSGSLDKGEVRKLAQSMGMNLNAKALDEAFSQMDTSGDGDVDFEEFFEWYAKNAESDGGMFYSFTQKGNLSRMRVHVNELRRKFVPSLTFRREAGYRELVKRDAAASAGKMSKTEEMIADRRKQRGYQLEETFNEMDTSGDGALDKEEIGDVFKKMGVALSQDDLDQAMEEMDADGGGDVDFDEFKQWWDRNIESANESSNPVFAQLRAKMDDKRHKLNALKRSLQKFTGIADDAYIQALYDKEEASARLIRQMVIKEQELQRRAQAALLAGKGGAGHYVPRSKPADFDDWPIFKQKAWLLEEERRKRMCTPYQIEEKPHDFDDWPFLKQQMWYAQQYLAGLALKEQVKQVSYFRGIVMGFSELAISWTWVFGPTAKSFELYISEPDDDALAQPSRKVATVECIPTESQYRSPKHFDTVKDLVANTLYKFGITVNMDDGTVLPMTTLGHRMVITTAEAPMVELEADAYGFAETHISFDWLQPDAKKERAVGESVTLYRTGNLDGPDFELTTSSGQLADVENAKLGSAVVALDSDVTHYGPFPMFPLWKPSEVLFSFGVALKVRLPEGSRETHRTLPLQIIKHQTPPEPEFAYIHAKPLSFSDIGLDWGWNTTETSMRGDKVEKFVVFRSEGRQPTPEGQEPPVVQPTIEVATVLAIDADDAEYWSTRGGPVHSASGEPLDDGPVIMHYRECVASNLGPAETLPDRWGPDEREYTFGIVVHFQNGLKLDMRSTVQKTAPEPSIDYFVGETLSCSAVSLAWGWAEKRQLPIVPWIEGAERFAICRSEEGVDKEEVEEVELPAPALELASRQVDPPNDDYPDYVVTGLGPQGLCSLTDGMKYSFSVVVKLKNGVDLPPVSCTAWTAPRTFLDWTAEEVALWVRLDVGYPQYADTFVENDVSGAVAAVLTGEDMELDLKIWAWSPRMAILLAIKVMVENAKTFGHRAIGYQDANVDRTQQRQGAVWDAVRSVDGGPLWWRFEQEVVWGPDIPTIISKPWHEEILSVQELKDPTLWKLPPSTFKLRSHSNLRAKGLLMRPSFFKRDEPDGDVDWKMVHPAPRAVNYKEEIEGVDATEWLPRQRRRGLDTVGPVLWAAMEAGRYEAPEEEEASAQAPEPPVRAGAILPDSRRIEIPRPRGGPLSLGSATVSSAERSISPPSEPPSESSGAATTAADVPATLSPSAATSPRDAAAADRTPRRLPPHHSRPFKEWDAMEVSTWVKLVLCMPEHAQAFLDNDVNGELAAMLGAEELQEDLGVASAADRLKILTQIGKAALRRGGSRMRPAQHSTQEQEPNDAPSGDGEGEASVWLGSPRGQSWMHADSMPTTASTTAESQDPSSRATTMRPDANLVQQTLGIGKHRPETGPIATALRAATLRGKENANAAATHREPAAATGSSDGEVVAADPHWWKFVSDVTRPEGTDGGPAEAKWSAAADALPWERPTEGGGGLLIPPPSPRAAAAAAEASSALASAAGGNTGWSPPVTQLLKPPSDVTSSSLLLRKPKEWERLLDSATIRDLRQVPAWDAPGSSPGAGGGGGGRMTQVAKSLAGPKTSAGASR